jgi:LPPG:FO 2-phospho-L-lactate transferase
LTIAVLAGGTGSIKLVRGLAALEKDIVVISNVGDNIWLYGLYICPDIDTMVYGLANMLDRKRGWGIKRDSFHCLAQLKKVGVPAWFSLGDKDFFRKCYSISTRIIPVTDEEVTTTIVTTARGDMHLQDFWVKHKGRPRVSGIRYDNASDSLANPAALDAIRRCRAVIIAPANPISSIGPIIALSDLRQELVQNRDKVIGVSPLIGRKAISGPATKYMRAVGLENSSIGVAKYYCDFVSKFIISEKDRNMKSQIGAHGMQVYEANITMKTRRDEVRLGRHLLKLVENK